MLMILRFSVRNDKHIGTNNVGTQGKIRAICAPKFCLEQHLQKSSESKSINYDIGYWN